MSVEPYGADEESAAVLRTVGRVIKMCRERAGLTQAALGAQIGYSEEQVSSVEQGRRAPMEEFLDAADRVLEADNLISALKGTSRGPLPEEGPGSGQAGGRGG